jgi:hypothetical protein
LPAWRLFGNVAGRFVILNDFYQVGLIRDEPYLTVMKNLNPSLSAPNYFYFGTPREGFL